MTAEGAAASLNPNPTQEMYETHTIRVPKPIAVGTSDHNAFVVFEYLSMGGSRSGDAAAKMGKVSK